MSNNPNIKHIVTIASGKGGVGKSTTAVNIALALQQQGATVGLFDADIYGPSQPLMLGVKKGTRPEIKDKKYMVPIVAHGIQTNSMGFLVDEETAMVWRGAMVVGAFNQILNDTLWRNLDYLVVDMPPGTGDIQLSLAQNVSVSGAVIVTTPQDVALLDARRGIEMFRKVDVPILGVVENMSMHTCTQCGHTEHIFGKDGAARISQEYGVDLLGSLPLDLSIRKQTDVGKPTVAADPEGKISQIYHAIAQKVTDKLREPSGGVKTFTPNISIKDD